MKKSISTALSVTAVVGALLTSNAIAQITNGPATGNQKENTLKIAERFTISGWMGDGKEGTKHVQVVTESKENPKSAPSCIKVTYTLGPERWAGAYWLNRPDNWGEKEGEDLGAKAFKKITFNARGERGGEIVEFKAGGIDSPGMKYKDSFEVSSGKTRLEKDWRKYELNVEGKTLSNVIGIFCWSVAGSDNPNGLTFFLDDIQYE